MKREHFAGLRRILCVALLCTMLLLQAAEGQVQALGQELPLATSGEEEGKDTASASNILSAGLIKWIFSYLWDTQAIEDLLPPPREPDIIVPREDLVIVPPQEEPEPMAEEPAPLVPEDQTALWASLAEDATAYHIRINKAQNTVTVYGKDAAGEYTVPLRAMVCSTGKATPTGSYYTSNKYDWRALFGNVYGQYATRITGNILFHSVPYRSMQKNSLLYEEYNKLGETASMGCIRLTVEDAKWIYDYCAGGTYVTIYKDEDPGPLGKPEAPVIDVQSANKGWDPTDPDPENPWLRAEETL